MIDWTSKLRSLNLGSLLEYLPQTGLDCIPWIEFLRQVRSIIKVSTDPRAQTKWKDDLYDCLPGDWTEKQLPQLISVESWPDMDPEVRMIWGERILELYFKTLIHLRKTNLDFRAERFHLSRDPNNQSHWEMSRFFVAYEPSFGENIALMYQGYYEQRPKDFRQALTGLGVLGTEQSPDEIEKLLFQHFGEASDKPQAFKLEEFKKSYLDLFNYVRKHKRKIPANFIWMGLSLAGLYECLEKLGGQYRVREVYRRSLRS
jgi:hypothetical protein